MGAAAKRTSVKVHRIVAECFLPNPYNLPEVNHLDYNRANPSVDNLQWCAHSENIKYSSDKGHYKGNTSGELNGRSKLTSDIVSEIRKDYKHGVKISTLSKKHSTPYSTIFNIVHNKIWKQ